ncbi:rhamnulokinase [Salirhabdus sp. Marseille-P4669]|uniref:rhamnulokinase n=1 Tax=Salirhabdus sp. Marseille-P4669 TaxID=2042310 RepID=UPI000C79912D|nr:rhamnulokinase [Salirhabdus sp. Marseille-P4669]
MTVLAFDLGASSGRAVIGQLENDHLTIKEIHRFKNQPVQVGNHMHWDILRLFYEIKQGILKAHNAGYEIESIAIDSWAVDFGLLDKNGELLANPYHYRDRHTENMMDEVFAKVSKEEIFAKTGIQFMDINTIYHLYAMKKAGSVALEQADTFLMIPDLLRYFLTGKKTSEFTNATTTQVFNTKTKTWDEEILNALGIPSHIFNEPVKPGTIIGDLLPSICDEIGLEKPIPVMAVGDHDTASAVAAVPNTENQHFAYLSCGTWSLLGTEVEDAIINEKALQWNMTNEGGVGDTYRLLKNIMGLWLLQESNRIWEMEGEALSFEEQRALIESAKPFQAFVDPDHPMFIKPAHMPKQIQAYCRQTNQFVPETKGEILRCILESLAMKYRYVLEKLEQLVGSSFSRLHMVGGGIQNSLLCQFTADAIKRPVYAGPIEASSIGNILIQYQGLGKIDNVTEAREIVKQSFPIQKYEQQNSGEWEEAYITFRQLIGD